MNKAILIGHLAKDPDLKFTSGSGIAVTTFPLVVNRAYTNQDGKKEVDFIHIVCWRKLAESVANNLQKGRLVSVSGSIQVRKYQAQDGSNRYAAEVVADNIEYLDYKKDGQVGSQSQGHSQQDYEAGQMGFMPVNDDDIPF